MHDYNTYVWPRNCIHKHNYTQKNKQLVSELGTLNGHNKMIKTTEIVRAVKTSNFYFPQQVKSRVLSLQFILFWRRARFSNFPLRCRKLANSCCTFTIELIKHKTWEAHKRWMEEEDAWLLDGFHFRAETLNRKEWGQMSHFDTNPDTKNNKHQS